MCYSDTIHIMLFLKSTVICNDKLMLARQEKVLWGAEGFSFSGLLLTADPFTLQAFVMFTVAKVYLSIESETIDLDITLLYAIHNLRQENVSVLVWWNLSNYKSQKVIRCILAKFHLFNIENLQDWLKPALWNMCLKSITVTQNPHLCEFLLKWLAVAIFTEQR